MKKRILVYADSPNVKTGFGTVSRNILEILYNTGRYDIDIFGINYHGIPHNFPYRIWPAMDPQTNDPYGRRKFCYFAAQHDFDILWILQDTFIVDFLPELIDYLKQKKTKPFKIIVYYPVDSIIKPEWYNNIKDADRLVCYTNFGKKETLKVAGDDSKDIDVIYHGVNTREFFPLPDKDVKEFRENYFGAWADNFIFMNVNRNQQRKDIPRTIAAFYEFHKEVPESLLYLHMAKVDQGWNLPELCKRYDLSITKDVIFPENFEPNQAYPVEILNMLYNCSDCVVSTTLGEGFGLGWVEALACAKPIIVPNNTAMSELVTEDIGYLADSGSNNSLWTCIPNDNEVIRPLVDVDDMVENMFDVYNNYETAKAKAKAGYDWVVNNLEWRGSIADSWIKIFDEEADKLDKISLSSMPTSIKSEVL